MPNINQIQNHKKKRQISRHINTIDHRIKDLRGHLNEKKYSEYDLNEIKSFFPNANIKKLSEINKFHKLICDELNQLINDEIHHLQCKKAELLQLINPNITLSVIEINSTLNKPSDQEHYDYDNPHEDSDDEDNADGGYVFSPRIYPRGYRGRGYPYGIHNPHDDPQQAVAKVDHSIIIKNIVGNRSVLQRPVRSLRCKKGRIIKGKVIKPKKDD